MIGYIKGSFHPMPDGTVIIENSSGIGFLVSMPAGSSVYKMPEGSEVKVFTYMQVREDDISLYGFMDKEDLELFQLLITVKGIGAKAGITIMSSMPSSELKKALASGDVAFLSKAQGVGKKTAERLVLELKDKVGIFVENMGDEPIPMDDIPGDPRSEAVSALVSLGYSRNEAASAVSRAKGEGLTVEDYIKQALKSL